MPQKLIQIKSSDPQLPSWHWLDVIDPSVDEVKNITKKYSLPPHLIEDCLDPTHLPKHEKIGAIHFIIVRAFDETSGIDADTVQDLTRKIAVFVGPDFVLTLHRKDQDFLQALRHRWDQAEDEAPASKAHFLSDLLESTIYTYEKPIDDATTAFEFLEEKIFKPSVQQNVIEDGYYLKRKASVFKRMLRMTTDLLPKVQAFQDHASLQQNLRESSDNLFFFADELLENLNNLLTLHLSISSQKTNEVMRVLTIISIFFMPLNLIAGIYGMNFVHMPELNWKIGYPLALILMVMVTLGIRLWFKKRGWLSFF
jgi:magnesium transporter